MVAMRTLLGVIILVAGCTQAQVAVPALSDTGSHPKAGAVEGLPSASKAGGKVGLVRGVLKRLDPVHDQLLIRAFGGGDIRIAFGPRTQLVSENTRTRLASIPAGSAVSVDTVIVGGKLFALSVRIVAARTAELNGQVVWYDAATSQLTLRASVGAESVSLRMNPSTTVVKQGQPASPQSLSRGMLVHVSFSPMQHAAENIEIVAERGTAFTFEGRIIAIDLRSGVLALNNDSDQSVRELAIGSLDAGSLSLLREGAAVRIQAEFDGDRYNVRTVDPLSRNP